MADSEEDDPVVREVPVFLSKAVRDLLIFQYPIRPASCTYDDITFLEARVKHIQQKVELEIALNTTVSSYDPSKGKQIALNVDGHSKEDDCLFKSHTMDRQVLSSQRGLKNIAPKLAVGILRDGELHLNPVKGLVQFSPTFSYLDRTDAKQKQESKDRGDEDSSLEDAEEEAKTLTVKFASRETERGKKSRENSLRSVEQKYAEEPWVKVAVHSNQSEFSQRERQRLLCSNVDNQVSELLVPCKDYLKIFVGPINDEEVNQPSVPSNLVPMSDLRQLPLADQVKILLINAKVMRFSQLQSMLATDVNPITALQDVQQVAILVQGCWVVKSDILYSKDAVNASNNFGYPGETLCRGRDYMLWKFTQNRLAVRKEISDIIKLPQEILKEMLEQIARLRKNKEWEFILPYDFDFVFSYAEVVQRQQMQWDLRYKQLASALKLSKQLPDVKSKVSTMESPAKPNLPADKPRQRRRTKSQRGSINSDTEGSGTEASAMDTTGWNSPTDKTGLTASPFANLYKQQQQNYSAPVKVKSEPLDEIVLQPPVNNHPLTAIGKSVSVKDEPMAVGVDKSVCVKEEPMDIEDMVARICNENMERIEPSIVPVKSERMPTAESKPIITNGSEIFIQSEELQLAVQHFVQDCLHQHKCVSVPELRRSLNLKLVELPPGHTLGKGVTDRLLEEAAIRLGASDLNVQWPRGVASESVYAITQVGDHLDPWRKILFNMFQSNFKYRKGVIKNSIQDALNTKVSDAEFTKFLKEYCVGRNGIYYLKGTNSSLS